MLINSILIFIYLKLYVSQSWAKSEILIFRFKIFHNCAHLFRLNFIWADYEQNQRAFLAGGRDCCRRGCQERGIVARGTARASLAFL